MEIAGNIGPQKSTSSSSTTSSGPINSTAAKRLAFSASPSKKKNKPKKATDRNKCNICRVFFNLGINKKLKSPRLGCNARGCQFWIYANCHGFLTAEDDTLENIGFFCKNHMKNQIKICHFKSRLYIQELNNCFISSFP